MKKWTMLAVVAVLTIVASAAMAQHPDLIMAGGPIGTVSLFQKCDASLGGKTGYDSHGCPTAKAPWPILFNKHQWGEMQYSLWGNTFMFTFEGKMPSSNISYTLIYYPDPWPGTGLICLGEGTTRPDGDLAIHGKTTITTGLPASYDANHTPMPPSGAVGAKIWLVLSDDVHCGTSTTPPNSQLTNWNPSEYLFEGNLIIYQYVAYP